MKQSFLNTAFAVVILSNMAAASACAADVEPTSSNRYICAVHGLKATTVRGGVASFWLLRINGSAFSNDPDCRALPPTALNRRDLSSALKPLQERTSGPSHPNGTFYTFKTEFRRKWRAFDISIVDPASEKHRRALQEQIAGCIRKKSFHGLDEIIQKEGCGRTTKGYRLFIPTGEQIDQRRISCGGRRCLLTEVRNGWHVTTRFPKFWRRHWLTISQLVGADLEARTRLLIIGNKCIGLYCPQ